MDATASTSAKSQTFDIVQQQELRIECDAFAEVFVVLLSGTGEVFGAELVIGKKVNVSGQKVAVFTWNGAKLRVDGEPQQVYVAEETPMVSYFNIHKVLEARRDAARASGGTVPGPRVLVVGPTDSGKTTLCRMLCNWAVRSNWEPTMVDLDVGQGSITVPGCVAATPVEAPIDITTGYPLDMPLVFFFGHASPQDNPELYKFLVARLAAILDRRAQAAPEVAAAGLVINTLGWIDGLGYELQLNAIAALKADVVVVMERDSLYSQLTSELKQRDPSISVVKLSKSGGVVTRGKEDRRAARDNRIKEYFYGTHGGALAPISHTVRADDLKVWRIGGGPRAPTSALPIGGVSVSDPLRLAAVPVNTELTFSLLAVSHAITPDQVTSTNAAGFVLMKDVDIARGLVTFLAPCDGALPGRYLTAGTLKAIFD